MKPRMVIGFVVADLVLLLICLAGGSPEGETVEIGREVLGRKLCENFVPADVHQIRLAEGERSWVLQEDAQEKKLWVVTSHKNRLAKYETIDKLLKNLQSVVVQELRLANAQTLDEFKPRVKKESQPDTPQKAPAEVEKAPGHFAHLVVQDKSGKTLADLQIGKSLGSGDRSFILKAGKEEVYVVDKDFNDFIGRSFGGEKVDEEAFYDKRLLDYNKGEVIKVVIRRKDAPEIVLERPGKPYRPPGSDQEVKWLAVQPPGFEVQESKVDSLLDAACKLMIEGYPPRAELKEIGLDHPDGTVLLTFKELEPKEVEKRNRQRKEKYHKEITFQVGSVRVKEKPTDSWGNWAVLCSALSEPVLIGSWKKGDFLPKPRDLGMVTRYKVGYIGRRRSGWLAAIDYHSLQKKIKELKEANKDRLLLELVDLTPQQGALGEQRRALEEAVQRRLDGVLLEPADAQALDDLIAAADKNEVRVATFRSDCPDSKRRTGYLPDPKEIARALSDVVAHHAKDKKPVAVLAGPASHPFQKALAKEVLENLQAKKELKAAGVFGVEKMHDPEAAVQALAQLKLKHPDLVALVVLAPWMLERKAARETLGEKVAIVVYAEAPEDLELLEEGVSEAVVVPRFKDYIAEGLDRLVKVLDNEPPEEPVYKGHSFDTVTVKGEHNTKKLEAYKKELHELLKEEEEKKKK